MGHIAMLEAEGVIQRQGRSPNQFAVVRFGQVVLPGLSELHALVRMPPVMVPAADRNLRRR
jgi:hypothetical protein